jgi:hypothetical protein
MSEPTPHAAARAAEAIVPTDPEIGERQSMSSTRDRPYATPFDLTSAETARDPSAAGFAPVLGTLWEYILNNQMLSLILIVGIPLLVFCVMSSA